MVLAAELDTDFIAHAQAQGAALIGPDVLQLHAEETAQAVAEAGLRTASADALDLVTTPLMLRSVIQYVSGLGEQVITAAHRQHVIRRLASRSMARILADYTGGSSSASLQILSWPAPRTRSWSPDCCAPAVPPPTPSWRA